jgi:UDPglucose 6-dehydrogenase
MRVTGVGIGYVGLVSGTCFAEMGNQVVCVDNNPDKVKKLRNGEMVIYEPVLDTIFEWNIQQERLFFYG